MISQTKTNMQKDTQGPKYWHTNKQLLILQWMNNLQNLLYRGPQCLCFSKITQLQKTNNCWSDLKTISLLWNTKNNDRNSADHQNIHTTHRDSNLGKGYLVLVSDTLLF